MSSFGVHGVGANSARDAREQKQGNVLRVLGFLVAGLAA